MKQPEPILVVDLFPEERNRLLGLLRTLSDDEWHTPTVCGDWTVKDVAAHLLGGDLGKLSRGRDGFTGEGPRPGERFGAFLNRLNDEWVTATRRLSPVVLCDLLESSGSDVSSYFASLDPYARGEPVTWTGPDPAPNWLDIAREYTERWHHQQHIREAVGAEGLTEPRFLAPAIATYIRAVPHAYRDCPAPDGTNVQVTVTGPSGGDWSLVRDRENWRLFAGVTDAPAAIVTLDQDAAWRLFTNGLTREAAEGRVQIDGDTDLGSHLLNAVAIIT